MTGRLKKIAPSEDLRTWFDPDPERWSEFKRRCELELRAKEKCSEIAKLTEPAADGTFTLL